jgi:hypothetical protein
VIALVIVLAAARAGAAPPDRVLLADPDPELLHAVESSLAPWHLTVVIDSAVPRDDATAHARADVTGARFVVWREDDQLVVFDRDRAASERRPARKGAFDPVTAAAAALTVKTMMRLPPPPPDDGGSIVAPPPPPPPHVDAPAGGPELRFEAGVAARLAPGDGGASARGELAVMVRPWSEHGWRFGARGDLGTSTQVDRSGFKGTWSDWAVLAAASWTYPRGPWDLEPWLAAGVTRTTLDGAEASIPRTEEALLAAIRGGVVGRRRLGVVSVGLGVELAGVVGAPTYIRTTGGMGMGMPPVFETPSFSVVIGLVVAAELGR